MSSPEDSSSNKGVPELETTPARNQDEVSDTKQSTDYDSTALQGQADVTFAPVWRQTIIIIGILLGIFLAGLDLSIISTAIPAITSDFNSLPEQGWYGSVFSLTYAAFQSVWGKAYKYFDMKYVFLASIFWFEVGCLIGGVSPNSPVLIVWRAIQGSGAAGILLGCYSIPNFIVRPDKVPVVIGMIGTVFSVSSVVGPLIGGIFTSQVSWRWCFYINLPIGGIPFAVILFFFKTPPHAKPPRNVSYKEIALSFDPVGTLAFLASLICYFLAPSWGGTQRSWSSSVVIGCLVGWILLTIVFVANEVWQGERALVVLRLMKIRDLMVGCVYLFFLYGAYFAIFYDLPEYFQATGGRSAENSGIRTIPLLFSSSIVTLVSSIVVGKTGIYQPFLILGAALCVISGGLIYTFDVGTGLGKEIGYQILVGAATGLVVQIPPIVASVVTSNEDKATALAAVLVTQFYSAALVIAASSSITNNLIVKNIPKYAPSITPAEVLNVGAYDLQNHWAGSTLHGIRQAYVAGLRGAWALGIAMFGVAFLVSFLAKWPGKLIPWEERSVTEQDGSEKPTSTTEP